MPNQLGLPAPLNPLGIWSGARTDPPCSASDWGRGFGPRLLPWPFDTPSGKPPEGQEKAWRPGALGPDVAVERVGSWRLNRRLALP